VWGLGHHYESWIQMAGRGKWRWSRYLDTEIGILPSHAINPDKDSDLAFETINSCQNYNSYPGLT